MFFDHFAETGAVCAHRGARALAPENTMLAALLGYESGADFWEMDVHKVADGSLVVFHDDVLGRTTNVAELVDFTDRAPWPTHMFTLKELHRLDAGSWFVRDDPFGTLADGQVAGEQLDAMHGLKIPTLRETLEFTRLHDLPMNIEIKDQVQAPGDLSIVDDILGEIRESNTADLILISSFNHEYLVRMQKIAPEIPIAALVEDSHPDDLVAYLRHMGATGYHPDKDMVEPELVRMLAGHTIRVTPYTVNNMDQALSLIDAGCFGITTDFPHLLRQRLSVR
ncbi:glycerophosphodiester phosphodiesterase [Pseudodesulfovibrio piezophilus]|uniref:Putative Glycerophosphoryl diester phosphodiesterase family protein n=1 Tax=Pseudodesulfovibrio piezophilus (strain DSM 21447 / JCM 15486 / C1TLV30) TaxID=1322246 RepID=M1WU76_PSEP2|nr:glycerophosphodiester phosphodiesterase family protein [Pseudodesulfovibrio piezophilus]CCH50312.1 putative Glycerophosphoryl diester phosphodiesterase family protein [Pseudodesulfovibrio piezophilus C1TLV30]